MKNEFTFGHGCQNLAHTIIQLDAVILQLLNLSFKGVRFFQERIESSEIPEFSEFQVLALGLLNWLVADFSVILNHFVSNDGELSECVYYKLAGCHPRRLLTHFLQVKDHGLVYREVLRC